MKFSSIMSIWLLIIYQRQDTSVSSNSSFLVCVLQFIFCLGFSSRSVWQQADMLFTSAVWLTWCFSAIFFSSWGFV